jgi:phosphohistidine phosphatase
MALYLIQHGKSLPKDQDPDQGLSEDGITETERIAHQAQNDGVKVSQIRHSVKTRARQTAEIFARALKPQNDIQEIAINRSLSFKTAGLCAWIKILRPRRGS